MEDIRLTNWYGKYLMIYRVSYTCKLKVADLSPQNMLGKYSAIDICPGFGGFGSGPNLQPWNWLLLGSSWSLFPGCLFFDWISVGRREVFLLEDPSCRKKSLEFFFFRRPPWWSILRGEVCALDLGWNSSRIIINPWISKRILFLCFGNQSLQREKLHILHSWHTWHRLSLVMLSLVFFLKAFIWFL